MPRAAHHGATEAARPFLRNTAHGGTIPAFVRVAFLGDGPLTPLHPEERVRWSLMSELPCDRAVPG